MSWLKVFAVALSLVSANAYAQADYPSKPIRILLPFAPGGAGELLARLAGQRFQESCAIGDGRAARRLLLPRQPE